MPHVVANEMQIYYESTGEGYPIIFSHEYAGDHRSWAPQVSFFSRFYRCITYNHRGYPPSTVPDRLEDYTQDLLIQDLRDLVAALGITRAHFVGLSMGGNVVLNLAMRYPELCSSIVVASSGTGSSNREEFERDVERIVRMIRTEGMSRFADSYSVSPTRKPFKVKDLKGWQNFRDQLERHPASSAALLMEGVLLRRPPIFALKEQLNRLEVPALIAVGDEDGPCLDPAVFMKREMPSSGLLVLPRVGHTVNLEEPARFNEAVLDFLRRVEAGRWGIQERFGTAMLPD